MFDEILQIVTRILGCSQNTENILSFFRALQDNNEFIGKLKEFIHDKNVGWIELCSIHPREVYYIYVNSKCLNGIDAKVFKEKFSNKYFTDSNFGNGGKYKSSANLLKKEGNIRYQAVMARLNTDEIIPFANDNLEILSTNFPIICLTQSKDDRVVLQKKYGYESIAENMDLEKVSDYKKIKDWIIDYSKFHNAYTNFALTITLGYGFFDAVVHIGFLNIVNTTFVLSLCNLWENICRLYVEKNLKKESVKSAISAIMARNMSHNLGSHFISNTKHYFSNLAEKDTDKQRKKDYRGIRHTLQYIQERMDFVATIVSTDRFPYGPVNVKSQIFDELTPDEFGDRHGKATTNFLLDYIVFSEDISKQTNLSSNSIKLSLKLISDNGIKFGGQNKQENQKAKEEFAKLNLAVPGGILGRHAIFTIIENVIRNSAKHDKENIPKDGLTVSIKIDKDHLVIFDNKQNANKEISGVILKKELNERYAEIKILSDGAIDKSNKGLKEILISALWLNNHSLADWFGEYESIPREGKIEKLSEVLRVVAVDDNGDMTDDGENLGYYIALDRYEEIYYIKDDMVVDNKINYSSVNRIKADIIVANKDYEVFIGGNARQNEDVDINPNDVLKLSNLYPRFYENRDGGELPSVKEMMKAIIERNTGITVKELNDINIHIEPKNYIFLSNTSNINHCIWHAMGEAGRIRKNDILFKNHLSVLKPEEVNRVLAAYSDAAYIDSISGGDFTGTITQPFFLQDEFNRLKVIESALTEFVIIDERIFKNYGHGLKKRSVNSESETNELFLDVDKIFNEVEGLLSSGKSCDDIGDNIEKHYHIDLNVFTLMKNDRVLIREDIDKKVTEKNREREAEINKRLEHTDNSIASHKMIERRKLHIYDIDKNGNVINLEGINVANVTDLNSIKTLCLPTFLSIHLSIIEKIAKENNIRASEVMKNLKMLFGNTKFVTIHSGRGNLSAELEEDLKDYAFLSLSAIQAAMDDSKYFLSQLLYNNCYVGKGRLNHK